MEFRLKIKEPISIEVALDDIIDHLHTFNSKDRLRLFEACMDEMSSEDAEQMTVLTAELVGTYGLNLTKEAEHDLEDLERRMREIHEKSRHPMALHQCPNALCLAVWRVLEDVRDLTSGSLDA